MPGPNAEVAVRPAAAADLDALVESALGNALDSEGIRLDPAVVRPAVRALLGDPAKGLAFVAQAGGGRGAVVGSAYVTLEWSDWHGAWYWWVQSVHVRAAWRRKGVYSALHRAVLDAARKAGNVRSVRLYVERHNAPALAAYRRLGMEQTPYVVFEQPIR